MVPLAEQFLRNRRQDVWSLRSVETRDDFEGVRRRGANLAGTAAAYGFTALAEIGRLITLAAQLGDAAALRALALDLEQYLDGVRLRARPQ